MRAAVVERDGVRIGIFGVLGKDAAEDASFARPVTFTDPIQAARKTVQILREREKVDVIVCLSHGGTNAEPRQSEDEKLAAVAPFASGPVTMTGIANVRLKESDRIAAMEEGLRRVGGRTESGPDHLRVLPGPTHGARGARAMVSAWADFQ